ncbi:aldehyde dehydrogenase family protein [Acuticoccus sediminis]|uniref:aldehyde dehydrogenase (NAD(+)) n=1 Tax=Acuticoccus sediminis TaxID=2184697 RepID=A0A8B2NS42_9HYPH|nr:aldehyde dehydrogenase family protein [Acuticoccus sediminis]RAH99931.1 aldehyde dehydrogenase family protein [Acuticoccus sediminis]
MDRLDQVYIAGRFRAAHGREELERIDPTTEEPTGILVMADAHDAGLAVDSARDAFAGFSRTSRRERIDLLHALADAVAARAGALTEATVAEYGAPMEQARWRAGLAAGNFRLAARLLEDFAFERRVGGSTVIAQPVGVAVHIVPWNSVYNAISVKLAGALAAGCTVVVKASEFSGLQNQLFAECLDAAGMPPGVVNIVSGRGDVVGEALTGHPDVRKISFTGSNAVGKSILRKSADRLPRVTLELGGKAPTVVLDDADLADAAVKALAIAFANNGQACIAGTRALVQRRQLASFCTAIEAASSTIVTGDPREPGTTMGPLVNRRQFERVQGYIRMGLADGARPVIGGEGRPRGLDRGYFVRPTVFTDVTSDMTIAREEIFGPVLCVIGYEDEDHAAQIANDTPFGLHAYVIGEDDRARAFARRIDAGRVAINGVAHDPEAPFGGFRESGIGREYGVFGIEDHLELKAILGR